MGGRHPQGVTMSTGPADGHAAADASHPRPTPAAPRLGRLNLPVLLVAIGAGMVAALSPAAPTGSPGVDGALVGIAVGAVVLIGALARPWSVVALAVAALVIAIAPGLLALAAVALGIALWGNRSTRHRPELFAVSIGISLNVLARGELGGFLGFSALISITMAAVVFVSGLRRQPRATRRVTLVVLGVVALAATAAVVGFGVTVLRVRNELSAGVRWAEQAVTQMEGGDLDAAAASFALAADELAEAHEHLSGPLSAPAALIPVLAQHREAAIEMSGVGGSGAEVAAEALGELDLESLRLIDGRIDLEALARLRAPFERTHRAMVQVADAATRSLRSPWLIGRAEYALRDFQGSVAEHLPSLDEAIDALDLAPRLLGVERPQLYLVLFTPFSAAEGFGGSVAGSAELTADDGVLTLNPSGAAVELDAGAPTDFRGVAELTTEAYAAATGRRVDGAIAIDPEVLVHLLDQAGVEHPSASDLALDPANAASYLQAVLDGSLPDPVTLALDLGPLVDQRRLLVWSPDPAAEALFARVGLDGTN